MRVAAHGASAPEALPTWLQLTPEGPVLAGRDGRAYEIADPAAVIAQSAPDFPLLLDWDHESMWGRTRAAGWIDAIEHVTAETVTPERPSAGLWGHVERWTPEGADDVAHRRYRGISPVIRYRLREAVDGVEQPPVLLGFENFALTNRPNLRMAALHAQHVDTGAAEMSEEEMAQLRAMLGLDEAASGADILTAVSMLLEGDAAPPPPPGAEANRAETALRVSEASLTAARVQLAEYAAAASAADAAAQTALVDVAIREGRALELHRADLTRLAVSEDIADRETFTRLTAHTVGAPRGRVTRSGEARPGKSAASPTAALEALSPQDQMLYAQLTRGLGWTKQRALTHIAAAQGEVI